LLAPSSRPDIEGPHAHAWIEPLAAFIDGSILLLAGLSEPWMQANIEQSEDLADERRHRQRGT
jgi:hypothetical protein